MQSFLVGIHTALGDSAFIVLMLTIAVALSLKLIPTTTDMMVNAAAGLAGKHLGRQYRTLVINCSTNNPEVATMFVAFLFAGSSMRLGGIGTPLGSNFANIYLIFLVALGWVLLRHWLADRLNFRGLVSLLWLEKRVVVWHLMMSLGMFVMACFAFRLLTGQFPIGSSTTVAALPTKEKIALAGLMCFVGIAVFVWRDKELRRTRPELFEDIDEEDHIASWTAFATGTVGLVIGCYLINAMFMVATKLYSGVLSTVLGPAVFAVLHYFLGALVTSLPEMNVAIANYRRLQSADLNTALSSASASNMSNLAIAAAGCSVGFLWEFFAIGGS